MQVFAIPTKDHWCDDSKVENLEEGLHYFVAHYKALEINSIAFPKLGAGLGNLSWKMVGPLMVNYLSQVDIAVFIYITDGDQEYLST